MDTIKVVCGVIYQDGKVFICRRKPNKILGGYWEFPGGKIEIWEQPEDCLSRELMEELGMRVAIEKYFTTVVHPYEMFTIELIAFICQLQGANFDMTDHDAYEWVTIEELKNWNLAPADITIVDQLISKEKD